MKDDVFLGEGAAPGHRGPAAARGPLTASCVPAASHDDHAAVDDADALLAGDMGESSTLDEEASNVEEGRGDGRGARKQAHEPPTGMCACLSLAYFRPYFDVDTVDVRQRVLYGMMPIGRASSFRDTLSGNPDLYGPFWLSASLVFAIAATSNVSSYLHFTATNVRPARAPSGSPAAR